MRVPIIKRGQAITAQFLNIIGLNLNDVTDRIGAPQQTNAGTQPAITPEEDIAPTVAASEVWVEIGRVEETVRVTNPEDEDQYVDVNRIRTVTFRKPDTSTVLLSFTG